MEHLTAAELWQYTLPLREPLTVQSGALPYRQGLLLRLTDTAGNVGIGEIAPLPGLHSETLTEAEEQILSVLQSNFPLETDTCFPSVRCGIEIALSSLAHSLQPSVYAAFQPLNALIAGAKETLVERTINAVQNGYTTLKIKVGRHSLMDDITNIHAIREVVGNNIALRLDANRTWSLATALRLGLAVADCGIKYIEEPCKHLSDSVEFARETGIHLALDETLYSHDQREFDERLTIPNDLLATYVLKPAIVGGINRASLLAREANERGADAVVSSVFESGIALRFYALLQTTWNDGRTVACGLDTFTFFDDDTVLPQFSAPQGMVEIGEYFNSPVRLNPHTTIRIFSRQL